jgi:hypothetical protein
MKLSTSLIITYLNKRIKINEGETRGRRKTVLMTFENENH